jgi:hypothetical protein
MQSHYKLKCATPDRRNLAVVIVTENDPLLEKTYLDRFKSFQHTNTPPKTFFRKILEQFGEDLENLSNEHILESYGAFLSKYNLSVDQIREMHPKCYVITNKIIYTKNKPFATEMIPTSSPVVSRKTQSKTYTTVFAFYEELLVYFLLNFMVLNKVSPNLIDLKYFMFTIIWSAQDYALIDKQFPPSLGGKNIEVSDVFTTGYVDGLVKRYNHLDIVRLKSTRSPSCVKKEELDKLIKKVTRDRRKNRPSFRQPSTAPEVI